MAVPEPNSPEALRAAQKVRNVFYMIAAANVVIIAIVMWPRPKLTHPPKPLAENVSAAAQPAVDPLAQEANALHDRLIAAYHSRDAERFAREFSSAATPPVDEEYFRAVIIGRYHEEFGELRDGKAARETTIAPGGGVLARELISKKSGPVKSRATVRREDGQLRIVQWTLEKP
jgi:hypothetical protein